MDFNQGIKYRSILVMHTLNIPSVQISEQTRSAQNRPWRREEAKS